MNNYLEILEEIASVPGKKDKEALLETHLKDEGFRKLTVYLLNPFYTYGILDTLPGGQGPVLEFFDLMDKLRSRELTGNAAREAAGLVEPRELVLRVLNKDPKAGFGDSTVNKAYPKLLPDFPYMRCSLPKAVKLGAYSWEKGVFSQIKADGMFANINHEADGNVSIQSRQGSLFDPQKFPQLVFEVQGYTNRGTQTHGELLVKRDGKILPREIGNGILNSVLKGGDFGPGEEPIYQAWDQIPLFAAVSKGKWKCGYAERLEGLSAPLQGAPMGALFLIESRLVYSLDEAYAHYAEVLATGQEGTIIKEPTAPWEDRTSKFCVKLKLEVEVDLKITGFRPGNGKNADTFGAIEGQTSDGLLEVGVSGFTDEQRKSIAARKAELMDTIMTVRANQIMVPSAEGKLYSLFLPRHVEFRLDKTVADDLQKVKDLFEEAIRG